MEIARAVFGCREPFEVAEDGLDTVAFEKEIHGEKRQRIRRGAVAFAGLDPLPKRPEVGKGRSPRPPRGAQLALTLAPEGRHRDAVEPLEHADRQPVSETFTQPLIRGPAAAASELVLEAVAQFVREQRDAFGPWQRPELLVVQ